MKHINKQLGVDLHVLEQKRKDRKAFMEGVNILVLILLGCSGLYLYTNMASSKKSNTHLSNMTANTALVAENSPPETIFSAKTSKDLKEQLLFEGNMVKGEQVSISFESFNKEVNYRIDFGDGQTKRMKSKTISHVYGEAGKFNLQLIINHKNKPVERVSKPIFIEN